MEVTLLRVALPNSKEWNYRRDTECKGYKNVQQYPFICLNTTPSDHVARIAETRGLSACSGVQLNFITIYLFTVYCLSRLK